MPFPTYMNKNLNPNNVGVSPIGYTRICLVDDTGRVYDKFVKEVYLCPQDDGKTLKIFVKNLEPVGAGVGTAFGRGV